MMYFAEAISIRDSQALALIFGFASFCIAIPVLLGGYFMYKNKQTVYKRIFSLSIFGFLISLAVFGLLSGVGTRISGNNVIDTYSWIFWTLLIAMIASSIGIFISFLLLIREWYKKSRVNRS